MQGQLSDSIAGGMVLLSSRHKEVQEVSNISTDRFYIRNGTQHPLGSLAISYTETQTNKQKTPPLLSSHT